MKKPLQPETKNLTFLLLLSAISAGIFAGAVYGTGHEVKNAWVHQYFLPEFSGGTIYEVFRNTFISLFLFIMVEFVTGLSAIGQPAGVLMLIYRGFGIGASVSAVYMAKGLHAMPEVLILILPECLAVAGISILAVREQMRLSRGVFMAVIAEKSHTDKEFRLYCLEFIVLTGVSLLVAVFATIMNYVFSSLR